MVTVLICKASILPIGFYDYGKKLSLLEVEVAGERNLTFPIEREVYDIYLELNRLYGDKYSIIMKYNRARGRNEIIIDDK